MGKLKEQRKKALCVKIKQLSKEKTTTKKIRCSPEQSAKGPAYDGASRYAEYSQTRAALEPASHGDHRGVHAEGAGQKRCGYKTQIMGRRREKKKKNHSVP